MILYKWVGVVRKSESHHNFPCDETYIHCPSTSVFKPSSNFNNDAQQRHLEDVLNCQQTPDGLIQSGTDVKLILKK